jgi:two-component system cell cycle sensor histidine kinase/response regulator CckA
MRPTRPEKERGPMSSRLPHRDGKEDLQPGRIALAYGIIGVAWILGSGYVVTVITAGQANQVLEVGKGWGFIAVTATGLYFLLARRARAIRTAESARAEADEERVRLATALEQAAEGIVITDHEALILYVNPAFEALSGYSRAELMGQNPRLLQSGRHAKDFFLEMWATLTAGETWRGDFFNLRKDGVIFEVDAVISPLRDSAGNVDSYVGVERDVGRERALERELAEAGRMEAVGQLAGGIAHDFNNVLTAISGYAELLRSEVPPQSEAQADVDEILRASRSAAALVRQLLAFGRRQVLEPAGLGLDVLVEQLSPMLGGLLGPGVRFEVHTSGPLEPVFADPGQIEQVLVNLAVNARDAMPLGGTFRIAMSNAEVAVADDRADRVKPGRYVVLAASDTGIGMEEATRARVFEPFFTTKPAGRGTGLGLATTYGIVRQSGGYLFAESKLGLGTTLTMYLPQHPGVVAALPVAAAPEPAPGGSETVLVVEDDPAVRAIIAQALERLGYRVLVSSDAAGAMGQAAGHQGRLPLLVSDIRLPGLDGPALARQLRPAHPGLRVLYVSGYAGDAMVQSGLLGPDEAFLAKPFSADELARRVRALLDTE